MLKIFKNLEKKSRNRVSKVEKLKEKLEIAKINQQFEEIQAKKAQSEAKKTEKEFDGIIEKVKGYKDMMAELGVDQQQQDEFSKILLLVDKFSSMGASSDSKTTPTNTEAPINSKDVKSDIALMKKAKNFIDKVDVKEIEMLPAPLVKKKVVEILTEAKKQVKK